MKRRTFFSAAAVSPVAATEPDLIPGSLDGFFAVDRDDAYPWQEAVNAHHPGLLQALDKFYEVTFARYGQVLCETVGDWDK